MPLYEYACACGTKFDRILPLADYAVPQSCPVCNAVAVKQLSAPMVRGDLPGYQCPITGDWVEGRRAHEKNLAKHGCRVLESGEVEQAKRASAHADESLSERIAETAVSVVENMPAAKREQLGRELSNGADITVERL